MAAGVGESITGRLRFTAPDIKIALAHIGANTALTALNFWNQSFGGSGIQHFARVLEFHSALTALNLSYNHLEFEPDYNNIDAAEQLSRALIPHTALTALDLGCNYFGPSGIQHLAQILVFLTALTTLNLNNNEIGDIGAEYL